MGLAESSILVTGGSRGIGRALVETLVSEGRRVAFTWKEREDAALETERASGGLARAFRFDAADRDAVHPLVDAVEGGVGPIEGLVNNVGIRRDALLAATPDADWDAVLDVSLGATFRLCRAVLPRMISRRRGSLVNVSSLTALRGVAGQTAYGAAKAGLVGMTKSLAREVGRRGIRVNAVIPGLVMTDMVAGAPPEILARLREAECLPGGTTPRVGARVIAFLLSDAAAAVTGQSIVVDAGSSA
jgi:3-oxoacyl-[acyl-carrier protein] reductase